MNGSFDSAVLGDRFRLARAPTLLARRDSATPIGFTRLKSEHAERKRARDVPAEKAFSFHVVLQPLTLDMWMDGRLAVTRSVAPGATFALDLGRNPVPDMHTSFDVLRFYIAQASLDELAFERGIRRTTGFASDCLGSPDRVMHGLAMALLDHFERPNERSALFVDYVGLAFHAHVTGVYGNVAVPPAASRELAPWQLRRVLDFIVDHLDGDPSIADLAQQCGLSSGYFARAFRKTMGATPHQWLMRKRVVRARELLRGDGLALADIALACGFVDQSHLTRVFTKFEGTSPGQWRRQSRGTRP